jgi:hypothetical protein
MTRFLAVVGWAALALAGALLLIAGYKGHGFTVSFGLDPFLRIHDDWVTWGLGLALVLFNLIVAFRVLRDSSGSEPPTVLHVKDAAVDHSIEIAALESHIAGAVRSAGHAIQDVRAEVRPPKRPTGRARVNLRASVSVQDKLPPRATEEMREQVINAFMDLVPVKRPPEVRVHVDLVPGAVPSPATASGRSALRANVDRATPHPLRVEVRRERKPEPPPESEKPEAEAATGQSEQSPEDAAAEEEARHTPPPGLFMGEIQYPVDDEDEDEDVRP